jgi:hypothetical protein
MVIAMTVAAGLTLALPFFATVPLALARSVAGIAP